MIAKIINATELKIGVNILIEKGSGVFLGVEGSFRRRLKLLKINKQTFLNSKVLVFPCHTNVFIAQR